MKLSLSVRIVEAACKTKLHLPFAEFLDVAKSAGYEAVCMRASAGGVGTDLSSLHSMREEIDQRGLTVAMVTADSNVPLNNSNGPDSLRDIRPSLDVAEALGCDLIRICMKKHEDIEFAKSAADLAAERGIRLAHQCHTASLFEEVDATLGVIEEIGRPNFGLIYEPANLLLCNQSYARDTLQRIQPHLMNVYVQNHVLTTHGQETLPTYCRGEVRYDHLEPWEPGGVDFDEVFAGLEHIEYEGHFTIHQARGITTQEAAFEFARKCAEFVNEKVK